MSKLKILTYPNPILESPAKAVEAVDSDVRRLVRDMAATLYSTTGVGLAAPQVGRDLQVIIVDPHRKGKRRNYRALVNPRVVHSEGKEVSQGEGCKSVLGQRVDIPRASRIRVEALDLDGNSVAIDAEGFEAAVLQHEIDHLKGRLLTRAMEPRRLSLLQERMRVWRDGNSGDWPSINLRAIWDRLSWLDTQPDGVLISQRSGGSQLIVLKSERQVQLYFANADLETQDLQVSGIMSRIDLDDPMNLLGLYTQAMMLSLVWVPEPERIHVVGFGGGRVPMVFHHYFPDAVVEGSEIDRQVIAIALKFFAIKQDERMKVHGAEGRELLQRGADGESYDVILVDCYSGSGHHPPHLASSEFYELCRRRLRPGGIVATNLVKSDPLFERKVATFIRSFSTAYVFDRDGHHVFFGTEAEEIPTREILQRAAQLDERYQFRFPLGELARAVRSCGDRRTDRGAPGDVLVDAELRGPESADVTRGDPRFDGIGRNDPCPCGSGKKFKKCHGR